MPKQSLWRVVVTLCLLSLLSACNIRYYTDKSVHLPELVPITQVQSLIQSVNLSGFEQDIRLRFPNLAQSGVLNVNLQAQNIKFIVSKHSPISAIKIRVQKKDRKTAIPSELFDFIQAQIKNRIEAANNVSAHLSEFGEYHFPAGRNDPTLQATGTEIPLKEDVVFGTKITLTTHEHYFPDTTTVLVYLPFNNTQSQPYKTAILVQNKYTPPEIIKEPTIISVTYWFKLTEDEELVPGEGKIEVWHHHRKLDEQLFSLTALNQ